MKNTTHQFDVHIRQLPPALAKTLRQAAGRIRRILFVRGILAVAATALIALLLVMAVDAAVVIYNPLVRWGLSLAGLAAVEWVGARALVAPMAQRFSPARIAALIEQRHPELEERLSTVVELLAMPETYGRGSEQLVALITEAAEADARGVTPKKEFTGRTVKPKLVAAAVETVVLGALFAAFPHHTALLALRALAPFKEIDNVFAKDLVISPGNAVVLIGDPLEVKVGAPNSISGQAYLRRQITGRATASRLAAEGGGRLGEDAVALPWWKRGGREITERMRQTPPQEDEGGGAMRHYTQLFPSVEESFRYRIACGHALTRRYTITAVAAPHAEIESIRYEYPPYTGTPPLTQTNLAGGVNALVGTLVTVNAKLNRPGVGGVFSLPPLEGAPVTPGAACRGGFETRPYGFTLTRGMNTKLSILLRDGYGFTNNPIPYPVIAIPDRPPTITFTRPNRGSLRLARNARFSYNFRMTDDYGVTNVVLHIARNDDPFTQHSVLDYFEKTEVETWEGSHLLNLASLDLANVSKLRLQLSVEDNLPKDLGGPQVARSNVITIELDAGARALEIQQYQDALRALEEALRQILEQMKQAERSTEEIRSAFDRKEQPNSATQQKLDNIRQEIAKVEDRLQQLAEENMDSALREMAEKLDQLRENQIEPARQTAEDAQLAAQEEQPMKVRDLEKQMQDAIKTAEDMFKEMQKFNEQFERLAKLDELTMREQTLADTAQGAEQPNEMNDWRNQQEDVRNQFNQQTAEMQRQQQRRDEQQRPYANLDAEKMQEQRDTLRELAEAAQQLAADQAQLTQAQRNEVAEKQQAEREQRPYNPPQDDNAQRAQQEQGLAQQAQQLAQQTEALRNEMQEMGQLAQNIRQPLQEAKNELQGAQRFANEAAQTLQNQQRNPHESLWRQEEAQRNAENAAASLMRAERRMDQLLAQAEQQMTPPPEAPPPPPMNAAQHMQEASREAQQQQMQNAEQHAQEAANQMRQMVQQEAQRMNVPMEHLPSNAMFPAPPTPRPQPRPRLDLPEQMPQQLRDQKLPDNEWFRLRGELNSQAMEDALRRVSPEYRDLVRMYFRELSKQNQ
jgi:hypothetical protein